MNRMRAANQLDKMADSIEEINGDFELVNALRFGAKLCRISPKWHSVRKPPLGSGEYLGIVKGVRMVVRYDADLHIWQTQKCDTILPPTMWCHMIEVPKEE